MKTLSDLVDSLPANRQVRAWRAICAAARGSARDTEWIVGINEVSVADYAAKTDANHLLRVPGCGRKTWNAIRDAFRNAGHPLLYDEDYQQQDPVTGKTRRRVGQGTAGALRRRRERLRQ